MSTRHGTIPRVSVSLGLMGRYSGTPSPYYNDSHRRLAQFMREYVSTALLPHAQTWEDAEEIPSEVPFPCSDVHADCQVYKRHADVGCLAAMLGPKHKLGPYMEQSGITLPINIPLEQWDPFHDFIVPPFSCTLPLTFSAQTSSRDWAVWAYHGA